MRTDLDGVVPEVIEVAVEVSAVAKPEIAARVLRRLILLAAETGSRMNETTELSKAGLFSNIPKPPISIPPLTQIAGVVCHSVLDQMFFFGLISQTWLKKSNPYLIIYLTGIIFAIAHTQLTVGVFAMGLIGCLLYHLTGTLIASTIFQLACLSSGFLLKASYPRLVTLLGFLF